MRVRKKEILIIELNEFNRDLMESVAIKENLSNLLWLTSLHETVTHTSDTLSSERLEPWVQWVSVHTGQGSTEHGIRHLGDITDLKATQVWNRLSERNITSGVWGAMNASRNGAKNCLFFIPDPWTFSEDEYPTSNLGLIALPRYLAQNRVRFSTLKLVSAAMRTVSRIPISAYFAILGSAPIFISLLLRFRFSYSALYTVFEFLSVESFIRNMKTHRPNFSILFLNAIAHIQHYYWNADPANVKRVAATFRCIDLMVGRLRKQFGETHRFAVMNALSQECTINQKPFVLYRLKDVAQFMKNQGLTPTRVEPLMTYDATAFFGSRTERDHAAGVLSSYKVLGSPLFKVERSTEDDKRLFFRIDFSSPIEGNPPVYLDEQPVFDFFDQLVKIVTQTGKHSPSGTVFHDNLGLPGQVPNTEIFKHLEDAL